jgi:hypothetical protein
MPVVKAVGNMWVYVAVPQRHYSLLLQHHKRVCKASKACCTL